MTNSPSLSKVGTTLLKIRLFYFYIEFSYYDTNYRTEIENWNYSLKTEIETEIMFKTETELKLELFLRNWTETETEIISGTEISLGVRHNQWSTMNTSVGWMTTTMFRTALHVHVCVARLT